MGGVLITPEAFTRIQRAVTYFERHALNGPAAAIATATPRADLVALTITDDANADGLYPCTIQQLTDPTAGGTYDDLGTGWALTLNGDTLEVDQQVLGRPAATYEEDDEGEAPVYLIGAGGSGGSGTLLAVSGQISTTFFGTGKLVIFPTGGGSPSLGSDVYVQQFLHYPGPESSWLLGAADNPFLGTFIGVGDPAFLGTDLPVYAVIPRVATSGLTVIGKSSGAGNNVTYAEVDTMTFHLPELVSGGNGAVDIGLQNLNVGVTCANGNITGNAAWED